MATSDLKSCPFCGSDAIMWSWNGGVIVECSKYNQCCHHASVEGKTEAEAIEKWNHRVERTAKVVPMVKEILGGTETITITSCELCKRDVTMWDRFCPNCGARLEWGE